MHVKAATPVVMKMAGGSTGMKGIDQTVGVQQPEARKGWIATPLTMVRNGTCVPANNRPLVNQRRAGRDVASPAARTEAPLRTRPVFVQKTTPSSPSADDRQGIRPVPPPKPTKPEETGMSASRSALCSPSVNDSQRGRPTPPPKPKKAGPSAPSSPSADGGQHVKPVPPPKPDKTGSSASAPSSPSEDGRQGINQAPTPKPRQLGKAGMSVSAPVLSSRSVDAQRHTRPEPPSKPAVLVPVAGSASQPSVPRVQSNAQTAAHPEPVASSQKSTSRSEPPKVQARSDQRVMSGNHPVPDEVLLARMGIVDTGIKPPAPPARKMETQMSELTSSAPAQVTMTQEGGVLGWSSADELRAAIDNAATAATALESATATRRRITELTDSALVARARETKRKLEVRIRNGEPEFLISNKNPFHELLVNLFRGTPSLDKTNPYALYDWVESKPPEGTRLFCSLKLIKGAREKAERIYEENLKLFDDANNHRASVEKTMIAGA